MIEIEVAIPEGYRATGQFVPPSKGQQYLSGSGQVVTCKGDWSRIEPRPKIILEKIITDYRSEWCNKLHSSNFNPFKFFDLFPVDWIEWSPIDNVWIGATNQLLGTKFSKLEPQIFSGLLPPDPTKEETEFAKINRVNLPIKSIAESFSVLIEGLPIVNVVALNEVQAVISAVRDNDKRSEIVIEKTIVSVRMRDEYPWQDFMVTLDKASEAKYSYSVKAISGKSSVGVWLVRMESSIVDWKLIKAGNPQIAAMEFLLDQDQNTSRARMFPSLIEVQNRLGVSEGVFKVMNFPSGQSLTALNADTLYVSIPHTS